MREDNRLVLIQKIEAALSTITSTAPQVNKDRRMKSLLKSALSLAVAEREEALFAIEFKKRVEEVCNG